MRPRGSIISQLLVTFCVCAILIGVAAVIGYITVTGQNAQTGQIGLHYEQLARENGDLENEFGYATFAVLFYTDTGQHSFLVQLAPDRAEFDRDLAAMGRGATPSVRGLINAERPVGLAWLRAGSPRGGGPAPNPVRQYSAGQLGRPGHRLLRRGRRDAGAAERQHQRAGRHEQATPGGEAGLERGRAGVRRAAGPGGLAEHAVHDHPADAPDQRDRAEADRRRAWCTGPRGRLGGGPPGRRVHQHPGGRERPAADGRRPRAPACAPWPGTPGLRIREHLAARDVLSRGQAAVRAESSRPTSPTCAWWRTGSAGRRPGVGLAPPGRRARAVLRVPDGTIDHLHDLFRAQTSQVISDLPGGDTGKCSPRSLRRDAARCPASRRSCS